MKIAYRSLSVLASVAACFVLGLSGGAVSAQSAPTTTAPAALGDPNGGSAFALTADPNYKLRPGDVIAISVYNEPSLSQVVRVLPGGYIEEPLVGNVRVGGLTPAQARQAVGQALHHYLRHPEVTVAVSAVAPVDVFVFGNVRQPGRYQLQPESRVMDALAAAGGLGPTDGDLPDAQLSSGGQITKISLQRMLHDNDLSLDTQLHGQTTIYVPSPTVFDVDVNGAVDHPGAIPMHEGDRLVNAIARAGTSTGADADLNHVTVRHRLPDGQIQAQTVNMYDIYKNGDGSKDLVLAKGDTVYVPAGKRHNTGDVVNPLTSLLYVLGHF
jgi:polysaccharide export outer membrane protein